MIERQCGLIKLNLKIIDKSMTDIAEDLLTLVNHALNDRHMTPSATTKKMLL